MPDYERDEFSYSEIKEQNESSNSKRRSVKRASVADMFRDATTSDRFIMIIGTMAAFGSGVGTPLFMFIFGQMTRGAIIGDPKEVTRQFAIIMSVVGTLVFILITLQNVCWLLSSSRQVSKIKIKYFGAVLRQDIYWHDRHKPGELISRMMSDTLTVQNGINDRLSAGIMSLGTAIFGFIFAFISSWEVTVFFLSALPIGAVICIIMIIFISRFTSKSRNSYAAASSIATEVMENIKTTQSFNQEEYESERYNDTLVHSRIAGIRKEFIIGATMGLLTAMIMVACGGCLLFASFLIKWGRADVGTVSSGFMALLYGSMGLAAVFPSLVSFMESRAAAYHLIKTIDRIPKIDIDSNGIPFKDFFDSIVFKKVSFKYNTRQEEPIFNNLNITIKKGQKVAFTGASGSGKTTIISLVQRFYDPTEGALLVDGEDLRLLSLFDWRQKIGVVSQEPSLFTGTIKDNVCIGKRKATLEDAITACKEANIHDTIMKLPYGYDTDIGEGQLSGGQKQRLAIARALLKKPSILLLDEATSALDRKSEIEIQQALDVLMKKEGMTVIVIAHRLSTIKYVDCIYYVENEYGKCSYIKECGTYDELLFQNGSFAAMVMMQSHANGTLKTTSGINNSFYLYGDSSYDIFNINDELGVFNLNNDVSLSLENVSECSFSSKSNSLSIETEFEENSNLEFEQTNVSLRRIMRITGRRWAIFLGAIGSLLNALTLPGAAVIYGGVIGVMGEYELNKDAEKMQKGVIIGALLFLGLAGLTIIASLLQSFYGYAGEHLTFYLRTNLFRAILRQDQTFFDIPVHDPGALSGIISGDCEVIHQLWGPTIGAIIRIAVFMIGGLAIGILFQWKVALLAAACMPIIIFTIILQSKLLSAYTFKDVEEALHTIAIESFSSITTITSFNMKDKMLRRYIRAVNQQQKRSKKLSLFFGINAGLMQFMLYATVALAFWYGGILMDNSQATFEEVMTASLCIMMCLMSAGTEVGGLARNFSKAKESAKRVFSIIDRVPDVDVYEIGDEDIGKEFNITFEDVRFFYPSRPEYLVLDSTKLHFINGTSNGLMGQTGCGKSTIIQILARFYNPKSGRVLINEKDLCDIDILAWRENISLVLQEPSLFSGSVKDNIRYSYENASDEEIEEAAKIACIHDDIMRMPNGYDTQVGYRGRELSGGQKQRVAIARAVLRKPKLLLLDEATSALDNATEAAVQKNLYEFQIFYRITMVSIAHRLMTIRNCDQIVLIDVGKTIEHGTHEELMASNGEYKARWELAQ